MVSASGHRGDIRGILIEKMASASGHRGDRRVFLTCQKMASASGHRGDRRVILIGRLARGGLRSNRFSALSAGDNLEGQPVGFNVNDLVGP
jgi:hypothetical protein